MRRQQNLKLRYRLIYPRTLDYLSSMIMIRHKVVGEAILIDELQQIHDIIPIPSEILTLWKVKFERRLIVSLLLDTFSCCIFSQMGRRAYPQDVFDSRLVLAAA